MTATRLEKDPTPRFRIAMMLESDEPGGAEMMVYRLSEELRDRGHEIVPIGPARGVGWLGDLFRQGGFSTEVFHLERPIDPGCVRRFVQLFRRQHIDLVHSHEFTMAVYGSAASQLLRLPHLVTMHGGIKEYKVLRRRVALRWALRSSDYAVMVSRATQTQFALNLGVKPSSFTVVPNGVPVNVGNPSRVRAEFGITERERVILAVGVLEPHKGHRILLEALGQLRSTGFNTPWRLIVAGGAGGSQHESLLEYVRAAGLGEQVDIATNRNDVADLLSLADVFVMPSLWEGLPMALLEAMVAGKAIVASATGGIPEAIINGREGVLVPPGDIAALADALRLVLVGQDVRGALAERAATRARKEFTVQVMADSYEALYTNAWLKRKKRLLSA